LLLIDRICQKSITTMKKSAAILLLVLGLTGLRAQVQGLGPVIISSVVPAATLGNVSCRAYVGTGPNVAIAGFVVTGQAGSAVQVLVRGVGPSLSQFALTGVLAQPVLTLFDAAGKPLAANTAWGTNASPSDVSAAAAAAGAFALPAGSADSALLATLPPGNYTAQVSGLNNTTGTALIEVYSVPSLAAPAPPTSPPPATTEGAGTG
jgi:hypothetical protein